MKGTIMFTVLLLIIIYLAFISLGLPDALLGVAWPAMRNELGLPLDAAGLVAIISIGFTVLSSLANGYIIRKLGTGRLTFISCLMTGSALLGISLAPSYYWMLLMVIPLGFGAGSVDAGLNNYVARHFKAHHMNWLHSFWGLGASMGPIIMGSFLINGTWRSGYRTVGLIQLTLAAILMLSLPLWRLHSQSDEAMDAEEASSQPPTPKPLRMPGVLAALATFAFYVTAEMSVSLWGSSYMVQVKQLPMNTAATFIALYYGGITVGRILSGFISFKVSNTNMIRGGILTAMMGILLIQLPLPSILTASGFIMTGAGFAPIFPSMVHETPIRFGKNNSGVIIGFQMAASYLGAAILPPLCGVLLRNVSMALYPGYIMLFTVLVLLTTERLNRIHFQDDRLLSE